MDNFDVLAILLVLIVTLVYFYLTYYRNLNSTPSSSTSEKSQPEKASTVLVSSNSSSFLRRMNDRNANVIIFYGSQTGTAEDYANRLIKEAAQYGIRAILADLMDYQMDDLYDITSDKLVVFVLSTYGDGEPTDNAHDFFDWLLADHPVDNLSNLSYSIFGLGNKTYIHYNAMARKCDERFNALGSRRVYERGEGDDDGNLEEDFVQWKEGFWKAVCDFFSIDPSSINPEIYRSYTFNILPPETRNVFSGELGVLHSWSGKQNRITYDQALYADDLYENNDEDLYRRCFHMELDISGTNMRYQAGDHVAIYAPNDPIEVQLLAEALGIQNHLNSVFEMKATDSSGPSSKKSPFPCPTTLHSALTYYLDICSLPKMHLLSLLSLFATDTAEKAQLKKLSSIATKDEYHEYILKNSRNLCQVLNDFKSVKVGLDETDKDKLYIGDLFETLTRLQPRYYSISSSPKISSTSVHVCATVVRYKTILGRIGNGIVTHHLSELLRSQKFLNTKLPIFIRKSHFKLPRNSLTPIILIGPGTGIAPLRGFFLERKAVLEVKLNEWREKRNLPPIKEESLWSHSTITSHSSPGKLTIRRNVMGDDDILTKMIGKTLLFFGCRTRNEDFLYSREITGFELNEIKESVEYKHLHDGISALYCAFSREQSKKIYVQDLIYENAKDVWNCLQDNGHIYICGDAKYMVKDVNKVLLSIAHEQGDMTVGDADIWFQKLKDSGRYQEDVWS